MVFFLNYLEWYNELSNLMINLKKPKRLFTLNHSRLD